MTKVTVKRVLNVGETPYFRVDWEGRSKYFLFKEKVAPDHIFSEEKNRNEAMEFAKKIESGQIVDGEEIIYQTPE